jgi:hypothetical protein
MQTNLVFVKKTLLESLQINSYNQIKSDISQIYFESHLRDYIQNNSIFFDLDIFREKLIKNQLLLAFYLS